MPVMIPGRAIGRITRSDIVSRPKKRVWLTAAAQSVPSTSAIIVEIEATRTDSHRACQTSARSHVTANHFKSEAGRRKLITLLLGGEGVEEDQQQRQMQEQ